MSVWVEDVSRQDAAALVVGKCYKQTLSPRTTTSEKIPFHIKSEISDRKSTYNIRVHVDVDRDGQVSVGDYITMESISLDYEDGREHRTIAVRKVE